VSDDLADAAPVNSDSDGVDRLVELVPSANADFTHSYFAHAALRARLSHIAAGAAGSRV
jgi:hypothetical protein